MERTFIVRTVATVTYDNYCTIDEDLWNEYKEDYPDLTDTQLAQVIYEEEAAFICDDSTPIRWDNEEVVSVSKEEN